MNVQECLRRGVGIYRRTSGGGTIYEDEGQLIYGLIVRDPQRFGIPGHRQRSFAFVNKAVIGALGDLTIHAEYAPVNDVVVVGKKISGCAQTRRGSAFLHHGTLIMRYDPGIMFSLLTVDEDKMRSKGMIHPSQRVSSLEQESGHPIDQQVLISSLVDHFSKLLGIAFRPSELSAIEVEQSSRLVEERYSQDAWNYLR